VRRFAGPEGVAEAVVVARLAAKRWAATPIEQRLKLLDAFRLKLVGAVHRFIKVVGNECDKTEADVVGEVFQTANLIAFLVKKAPSLLKSRGRSAFPLLHKRAWVEFVPLGVIGVISPWNYPIVLPAAAALQALAAGNSVVQKPSEYATETARLLHEIWLETGATDGLWTMVEGGPKMALALAKSGVDKIAFTGGEHGGRAILAAAAETLTPTVMELGGSDAMLVCPDANLQRAAEGAVWGAFYNAGQSCIGVRRCFVHQQVAEAFSAEVAKQASRVIVEKGASAIGPDFGAIRTPKQIERMNAAVADAVENGATVAHGPLPTVLTGVKPGMKVMSEELFAPILSISAVDSMDQAVELANHSSQGLAASVWSRDKSAARLLARRIHAGGVTINDCLVHFAVPSLPFGGVKRSGFGRSHGEEGLKEFCSAKAFLEDRFGMAREFHWFSSPRRHGLFRKFLGVLHPQHWTDRFTSLFQSSKKSS
jgi:acyl-CoA reductase-like NAD-dependent aldehyde dehydrogenase